jgi:hypothetical protein
VSFALSQRFGMIVPTAWKGKMPETTLRVLAVLSMSFGVWASYDRDMGSKLFRGFSFDFWDPSRPAVLFFISNLAILSVYIGVTHFAMKWVQRR